MTIHGNGIGLRYEHLESLLSSKPNDIKWVEILVDNTINESEAILRRLDDLRQTYEFVWHG